MIPSKTDHLILVTGGHGFIGSHCAARLLANGHRILIADIASTPLLPFASSHKPQPEVFVGNLCDKSFCQKVVQGVHTVLHFAAQMGGMGVIHAQNDLAIYDINHSMNRNIIDAAISAGVQQFFFASSACVYPESLQDKSDDRDVSLRETDVWVNPPPAPQGLYGLEKLNTELVLQQLSDRINIRIARFHNVYGPGGAWHSGKEKAPAAMLRKAISAQMLNSRRIEIWGSGLQRRSFLWIGDCVDAVLLLLASDYAKPLNIGSTDSVSINDLARTALIAVDDSVDVDTVQFDYKEAPVGVASRNSNNELINATLGWSPKVTLPQGMAMTAKWIRAELQATLSTKSTQQEQQTLLTQYSSSDIVQLDDEVVTFAILLPVTSRGLSEKSDCLVHLSKFVQWLHSTTWRDIHAIGGTRFALKLVVAIDDGDDFLLARDVNERNRVEKVLYDANFIDIVTVISKHPPGSICKIWRDCARRAWHDAEYYVLMGDDVVLEDEGWMRNCHAEFLDMSSQNGVPPGFGCVAFTDVTFPGMPTFPIVHRQHMDIFKGEILPDIFQNQDGDPYLYQLYRRWGCSRMSSSRIRNGLGGEGDARYEKKSANGWTFDTLSASTSTITNWVHEKGLGIQPKLTLDVIVPSYRVQPKLLDVILSLQHSKTCSVMFIVIIDDPASPNIGELRDKYQHLPDVRIRVNPRNLGASASRNRGMEESAAQYVHFLDDDVDPRSDLLFQAEKMIREYPEAIGLVGNSVFPVADSVFTAAVHLAGVTYFWDIASKRPSDKDLPWGVTANLIMQRNKDGITFSPDFPKTGGGEDIAFCLEKREHAVHKLKVSGLRAAPNVVVTHPWWADGKRSYWRFYMWSLGDGALVKKFPEHVYADFAPNASEILVSCLVLTLAGVFVGGLSSNWFLVWFAMKASVAIVAANVIHDYYRHMWRDRSRVQDINMSISVAYLLLAVGESSLVRLFSELGRTVGMIQRREAHLFCQRFDWFTSRVGNNPRDEERKNSTQRVLLFGIILVLFM